MTASWDWGPRMTPPPHVFWGTGARRILSLSTQTGSAHLYHPPQVMGLNKGPEKEQTSDPLSRTTGACVVFVSGDHGGGPLV